MSDAAPKDSSPAPGPKRRSLSGQGGILGRMFGSSGNGNGKNNALDTQAGNDASDMGAPLSPTISAPQFNSIAEDRDGAPSDIKSPSRTMSEDVNQNGDKRRKSSGVGRARDLFSSAKQSLSNLGSSSEKTSMPQSPMQKLGKADPALSVPQGSLNNSAGESAPGPRSTFRVGVTEDKNKKCRRTMEDTHAYLYNFLSTPAPALGTDAGSKGSLSLSPSVSRDSDATANASGSSLSPRTSVRGGDIVETDNGYFAIFDGHAGTFAADWCGKKVHILLEDIIRKNPNSPIPELLDQTFTSVDQQLEKLPLKNSGCTAVIAVLRWEDRVPNTTSATGSTAIAPAVAKEASDSSRADAKDTGVESRLRENASRQRVLYTANVGDARIVLCRNGKALRLSYDHKGSDENEGKRIAGAGGLILNNRVNGVLAVTRALGDAYMKDLVTGHPYTTETVIQPDIDEFLILACDGLWDVCSDQEAVDLIRTTHDPQAASGMLVEHALARFSTDNLSCMVVRFDNKALQQSQSVPDNMLGVEGDPGMPAGGLSEADAILNETKKTVQDPGQRTLSRPTTEEIIQEVEEQQEPGPELNVSALEAARKDRKP